MNTPSHTPGPWIQDGECIMFDTGRDPHPTAPASATRFVTVAEVCDRPNWLADAKLIAASPTLLEALKAMMRHFTIMCNGRWEVMEWVDDERWTSVGPFYDTQEDAETELAILKRDIAASARAAIAKATNA